MAADIPAKAATGAKLPPRSDDFARRHLGPDAAETAQMLKALGLPSLEALGDAAVPQAIRLQRPLSLPAALGEQQALASLKKTAAENQVWRSHLGMGYADTITPFVILRNILENPGWYTAYTPYQAEISQGRLEALLNFQTMIIDLTGLDVANASMLDESTAAAEAMTMSRAAHGGQGSVFFVSEMCHPQTIEVVKTRAEPLGIEVVVGCPRQHAFEKGKVFGALLQYPRTDGAVSDYREVVAKMKDAGVLVTMACDLLALTLLTPPGELGADIAVGSAQRFGVPLGFGGPHAAFMATRDAHKRLLPGRIVGVSKDAAGKPAFRLTLQTREQHIRREKATSNICTAQVLLAVIASMYAVYHGPDGLKGIAQRVHELARRLAGALRDAGLDVGEKPFFDTVVVKLASDRAAKAMAEAKRRKVNLRRLADDRIVVALDETTDEADVQALVEVFGGRWGLESDPGVPPLPKELRRSSAFMTHPVFHKHRSESEMLRYMSSLEQKDVALNRSMIPLGSCTMKLNATAEMIPVTWPEFGRMHPFAPADQTAGYRKLFADLEAWLGEITGFAAVSLQPNAGSQGEYAGLLVIKKYHESRGQGKRDVCLIPQSAHGTNPASAAMAGMKVVVVACDAKGNVDIADLKAKAKEHAADMACLMMTYPSTHGVFEEGIQDICRVVHDHGGQVYMDGANMNAQVGLCRPGDFGADVCHLNLHKTFCIPHGGGGPGMGPIGVAKHLAPFLPSHPVVDVGGKDSIGPISEAPWGSASILPISWMYVAMMGGEGLRQATLTAILNANYVAKRLEPHYPVLYKGAKGLVAHECILDLRPLKTAADVSVEDVAKRLMDYGFHAPTISFPVPGTMMIEPTESEDLGELDRFCDAMIAIREEVREIEQGKADRANNLLKNAPHTGEVLAADRWDRPYSRERAAFPRPWVRERKFWPPVGRIDNAWGDRNFFCSCPPIQG